MARRSKAHEIPTDLEGSIVTEPPPDGDSGLIDLENEPISADLPIESLPLEVNLRELPKCPSRYLKYDQLLDYLTPLSDLQWSHIIVYGYRAWPIIYRDPKYIFCASTLKEIQEDSIASEFGGGVYKLVVNDLDRKSNQTVAEAKLTISHIDHEPILNYTELDTGHRDNKSYVEKLKAKRILDQEGNLIGVGNVTQAQSQQQQGDIGALTATLQQVVNSLLQERRQAQGQGKSGIDEQVINRSLDLVGGAYKSALETAVKQGNVSEIDQMSKVMQMFTQMLTLLKPAESSSSGLMDKIFTMQAENHKAQLEMMRELLKSRNESQNAGSQVDGLLGMIEKVKNIFGLESGGAGKPSTLETVLDKAPTILEQVSKITGNIAQVQAMRAGMSGIQPKQQVQTGALLSPQSQPIPAAAQTVEGAIPVPTINDELGFDPVQFCNQYGQIFLQWINSGKSGYELAEWVENGFGTAVYLGVANIGKEKLIKAMQAVPQYWQLIAPIQPQAEQFIDEFIAYQNADEDDTANGQDGEGAEKPN